jgi:flagellin
MNALGNLSRTQRSLSDTFRKISSGQRVNRAADDAAGLAVAENLDAKSRSAKVAGRNINDGISVIQTYEGAANEVSDILKRQRELAVQSSSETLANTERDYLHQEFFALQQEHNRIAETTEFNGQNLMSQTSAGGTFVPMTPSGGPGDFGTASTKTYGIQVGVNNTAADRISVELNTLDVFSMQENYDNHLQGSGIAPGPNTVLMVDVRQDAVAERTDWASGGGQNMGVASAEQAQASLAAIDVQLDHLNKSRSKVGASQNRLESALNNIETYSENMQAAESRIRDADFAFETAEMSKLQVMQQAGIAILSQANGMSQGALRLI